MSNFTPEENRDLKYYATIDKVYWVVNVNSGPFKANDIVPCIFVEKDQNGKYLILKFDYKLEFDRFRYTAWRKFIGKTYNAYIDVLLIDVKDDNYQLYNLKGNIIDFNSLGRSRILVDADLLAKFDYKSF